MRKAATSILLLTAAFAAPLAASSRPVNQGLRVYSSPGKLARLSGGRSLNVTCMGRGSPTVILSAALGKWSETWRFVQPVVARTTRVCAWDRAGVGFSDGSDRPQTIAATVADLGDALHALKVSGPYVMVGHSLGGLETLLFVDRNLSAVRSMVLVDPSIPDQITRLHRAASAFAPLLDQANSDRVSRLRRCASGVADGTVRPGSTDPNACLRYPADYPGVLKMKLARMDMARSRWTSAISLAENFAADTRLAVNPVRRYGSMPLIVLSSSRLPAAPPGADQGVRDDAPRLLRELVHAHDELAALSSTGRNRSVPDTGHYIQIERPAAVIQAIDEVVARARRRSAARSRAMEAPDDGTSGSQNSRTTPPGGKHITGEHR